MSLAFLSSLESFRIPHLPHERINLRIGIHCGSVVAGVVAGKIHVSEQANHMLTHVVGGFQMEARGEVIIKGKGVMATYWLLAQDTGLRSMIGEIHRQETLKSGEVSAA
uniref:Guanylate cyclase domain-containing protein n=1 Tax=Caenorhabditis japonica TaxID=281687 RepID=A0A8R1EBC2_CAEJA